MIKVDIIIPTYKPDETFRLLLHFLQKQTFVVHRVIILNTEERLWEEALLEIPNIREELKNLPFEYIVKHIAKADFDHGGTRRIGAELSSADIMIFMTQDAVPEDEYLVENLVKEFLEQEDVNGRNEEQTSIAVAYARQTPKKECNVVERYTRQFNYPDTSRIKTEKDIPELGIKTFFCSDVCAAYRRDIYWKLGGFETPVIFNEDMFFAANAIKNGYAVAYVADARVCHSHNYTMMQQFHRNFDLAVSQTTHPEIFEQISSEAEGFKLVKNTIKHLFKIRKPWYIWYLFTQCLGKYAGYWLGKRYCKLSKKHILKCTMNKQYWDRIWEQNDEN